MPCKSTETVTTIPSTKYRQHGYQLSLFFRPRLHIQCYKPLGSIYQLDHSLIRSDQSYYNMFMECYFFYTFCNFIKKISFYVLKIIRFLLLLFLRDLFSFKNGRIQGYYICVYHFLSKEPDSLGSGNKDRCVDYTPGRTFISNRQFFFKVFFLRGEVTLGNILVLLLAGF